MQITRKLIIQFIAFRAVDAKAPAKICRRVCIQKFTIRRCIANGQIIGCITKPTKNSRASIGDPQCALVGESCHDHILKADAHHITKVFCRAVLSLDGQRSKSYGRSQQSN